MDVEGGSRHDNQLADGIGGKGNSRVAAVGQIDRWCYGIDE